MKNWTESIITPKHSLRDALRVIDGAGMQLAIVVDQGNRILGTLTDGDVRRALLKGQTLSSSVTEAMNPDPVTSRNNENAKAHIEIMKSLGVNHLPLVDEFGRVVGLKIRNETPENAIRKECVVIMAGGLGSRLKELTQDTPKPMLKIGTQPILETVITGLRDQGFRKFYVSVNYKAELIEKYFLDGSEYGVEIEYLREKTRLGTAGSLSLLPREQFEPLIVTNADILTKTDFAKMADLHRESGADATMGVRTFEMQVPYGVVREEGGIIFDIDEKPIEKYSVNAGIYILSPSTLQCIEQDLYLDMPTLFKRVVKRGLAARTHTIQGYWLDIGRPEDFKRANAEFSDVFGSN